MWYGRANLYQASTAVAEMTMGLVWAWAAVLQWQLKDEGSDGRILIGRLGNRENSDCPVCRLPDSGLKVFAHLADECRLMMPVMTMITFAVL